MEVELAERDKKSAEVKEDIDAKQTELDASVVVQKEMTNKIDSLMADITELKRALQIFQKKADASNFMESEV